jgi:hypothetical protein
MGTPPTPPNPPTPKVPPTQYSFALFANVGTGEPFVKDYLEVFDILNGTVIPAEEREAARDAVGNVLTDGLIPAFLELRKIRDSIHQSLPVVDRYQLYEDFARKLWKSYKDLMQTAAEKMGFDIGFLYQAETKFEAGLKKFRAENPTAVPTMEDYFRETRSKWQNELAKFRNTFVEHQSGERKDYKKFYDHQFSEVLFEAVRRAIVEVLVMLMNFRMPPGFFVGEADPNVPGPKWPKRFRFYVEAQSPKNLTDTTPTKPEASS